MSDYKELRKKFKKQILKGECYCILSGLPIFNFNDLSLEHLVPICRAEYNITKQEANIFPAYKVINSIKSNLLPCEWEVKKVKLLQKALNKGKLKKNDKEVVEEAILNAKKYIIDPCEYCVLYERCQNNR